MGGGPEDNTRGRTNPVVISVHVFGDTCCHMLSRYLFKPFLELLDRNLEGETGARLRLQPVLQ